MAFFEKTNGLSDERKTNMKWLKWALGEAGTRSVSHLFAKLVGVNATTLAQTFWVTGLIGAVQVTVGAIWLRCRRERFFSNWRETKGALLFGLVAFALAPLSFATFFTGTVWGIHFQTGDLGVRSVIVVLSIIPGAFIDWIFFGNRLNRRQWLGVAIGLLGAWAVVGRPSFAVAATLPIWVWLSGATALLVAVNQGITQWNKKINPLRKNFWGGLPALAGLPLIFLFVPLTREAWINHSMITLTWLALIDGLNVILMWAFNVWSYKDGVSSIAIKKLVALGGNLVINLLMGVVLFSEALTGDKIVGVALFLLAFWLMRKEAA